jgi:hypothetical protein
MTLSNLVDEGEVEGILHSYPKDKEVKVKYHPAFNGVAVLEPVSDPTETSHRAVFNPTLQPERII